MKHLLRLVNLKSFLMAGMLFVVLLSLMNSCKTSRPTSMSRKGAMTDTASMASDTTTKDVIGAKDKKP